MTFEEIFLLLEEVFGEKVEKQNEDALQPRIHLKVSKGLLEVATFLYKHKELYFDHLACISALDDENEPREQIEIIYQLYSYPYEHHLTLSTKTDRTKPLIPSLASIWKAADWHEREAYDMLGVVFDGHPDMRRLLMPADWEGFPLRKDYKTQDIYHGIKVDY